MNYGTSSGFFAKSYVLSDALRVCFLRFFTSVFKDLHRQLSFSFPQRQEILTPKGLTSEIPWHLEPYWEILESCS